VCLREVGLCLSLFSFFVTVIESGSMHASVRSCLMTAQSQ
jgi:hypothetical protein